MSRFLETMAARSSQRAADIARRRSLDELRRAVRSGAPPRPLGSFGQVFDLIAEVKPRSPAEGLFPERSPVEVARGYESGGAGMISVLTEPSEFGGSIEMMSRVCAAVSVPVLAKDFLVDPIQVYEARAAGADGVLVIARIMGDETLAEILAAVSDSGGFALLEAFDGEDLARISNIAYGISNLLIGVNCRDLDTLEVRPGRHEQLASLLPPGFVTVAESAIATPADVQRVAGLGYRAALVGSALMRAEAVAPLVRDMVDSGRRAVTVGS